MILPRKPKLSIFASCYWTERARLWYLFSAAALATVLSSDVATHITVLGCTVRAVCKVANYGLGVKFYMPTTMES